MGQVIILNETIKNPLSFMGECAGIAYGSDTTNQEKNKKRGIECVNSGHGRLLEFCDIYFVIDGYSIRMARELMRHVADGLTCIQRSTRYCNENNFGYYIPETVKKTGMTEFYEHYMDQLNFCYNTLIEAGVSKEDAANVLPLSMNTTIVFKHNMRTMISMAEQRLCSRTYIEYRKFMNDFITSLSKYSDEWKELCDITMKCKCDKVRWCEEHQSCGKYPKKEDIKIVKVDE